MKKYDMIIDGHSHNTGEYSEVINPATGNVFALSAKGSASDVDIAVNAASKAFRNWSRKTSDERKEILHQLAMLIEENEAEFVELVVKETGKPIKGLNGIGASREVKGAVGWTRLTAELELPIEVLQDNDEARVEIHRRPLGVVGSIIPWNWPLLVAIWHIMPALRVGNTVVIKPSPYAPIATSRFVELANTVLPKGVLNLVSGGPDVGDEIAKHQGVSKIIFTGSTSTGKDIMRSAADNLKRLTLRLSGNDAGIVLDDVDPKEIAPKLVEACFHNSGQTCAALKRLYVPENIYEALCDEMVTIVSQLVVGDGMQDETEIGPVQNVEQLTVVKELANSAREDGGQILCGGRAIEGKGFFFEPTLVAGLTNGHRLVDEEPFGPIVPIIKYRDVDEVVALANDNESGLGGSVWSNDIDRAIKLGLNIDSGSVWINAHNAIQPDSPFGAIKQSGFGVEFGRYGLEEFTSIQTLKIAK